MAKKRWKELHERSRQHLAKGEVGLAAHVLVEAINLAPDEPSLYVDMVKIALIAGSTRDALNAAFELRRIEPFNPQHVYLHAMASMAAGEVPAAKRILEEALEKVPQSWEVRQALAQVSKLLKENARAEELLREAVDLAPTEPGPVNDLALMHLERNEGAKARALLEKVAAAHPEHLGTRLNLALACAQLGDEEAVREHALAAKKSEEPEVREQAERLLSRDPQP
ncbi:MAG: tetratricopeptide repeat protein [Myxococcaceae bacterium]